MLRSLFCALLLWLPATSAFSDSILLPVQFQISGDVTDGGGSVPLERAEILLYRAGTAELLARGIFTPANGHYSADFQAEVLVEVGLGDPGLPGDPTVSSFHGFWVGKVWPNPLSPKASTPISLLYAAPEPIRAQPELELFDTRGRRIRDGESMASGVYLYRLNFDGRLSNTRKLAVLGATTARFELQRVASPDAATASPDGAPAGKRAEGTLEVDVLFQKAGYITASQSLTLNSRFDNPIDGVLLPEPPPTAEMSVGGSLIVAESVVFDGSASTAPDGLPLHYSWDFGDGTRGGGAQVAHVYRSDGQHTVELTVSSTYGATHTLSQAVNIGPATPPASTDASATGTIRDAIGNLLSGVDVSLVEGAANGQSDAQGEVTLTGLPTGVPLALLCEKEGYTTQVVRLMLPASSSDSEFEATLRKRRTAVNVAAIQDGVFLDGEDGVCLELPPDALQTAGGTPATGAAGIRMTPLNVSSDLEGPAFPGSYEGVRTDGSRGLILSFGAAEFVIEQAGQELQLKPGSTAIVEIPIYTPGATVDELIPLWSVDESTGLWVEEGLGQVVVNEDSPTGLALRSQVTHFSWWNCDKYEGEPYTILALAMLADGDGQPTISLPAGSTAYVTGSLLGWNGPATRPTVTLPPEGGVLLPLPGGADVRLDVSALNGTKVGSALVGGPAGGSGEVTITLDDPPGTPNELQLPVDTIAAIDPAGEVDIYTFEATVGQFFNASVSRSDGSTLEGTFLLRAPDDSELYSSSFGLTPASFAHEVMESGTFTIEVDGTANEPGGYHLVVEFSEPYEMGIPSFVDDDIAQGHTQVFLVEPAAGEWFSLNYVRREPVTFGRVGSVRVDDPNGVTILQHSFNATSYDSGLLQATEAGVYRVYLTSSTVESVYTFFVRDVPEILVGGSVDGSIDVQSTQYYRFAASQDDFVRAALRPGPSFTGNVQLVDGNNQPLWATAPFSVIDGTPPIVIPTADDYFVKMTTSFGGTRVVRDYSVAVNDILPPKALSFDGAGRAEVLNGQIGLFGDLRFFQFDAQAGDVLVAELRPGSLSTLGTGAVVQMYRIGSGSPTDPNAWVPEDIRVSHPGDASLGILEYNGFDLPSTDSYIVMVSAPSTQDGGFELIADRVGPAGTLTVDDDLQDCPAADTRNIIAAAFAAPDGGVVNICPGTYANIVSVPLGQSGVELVGADKWTVTLRFELRGAAIHATGTPARIANLTTELADPINSSGILLSGAASTLVEDVEIRAAVTNYYLDTGIDLGNGSDGVIVRRVRVDDSLRAMDGSPDNLLVEDCLFEGGTALIDLTGNSITLQNNVWNVDAIGTVVDIQDGAGHQLLDNQITILTPDFGANLGSLAVKLEDDDVSNSLPPSVIRGNQITTNEAGFDLRLNRAGSSILCERNFVHMTAGGRTALTVIPVQDMGAEVVIQNNVFEGLDSYNGMHLRWADWYGSLQVFNNSMRTDAAGLTQPSYPTVRIDLSPGSTFTGALPVQFVNNVLQGANEGIALLLPADTSIDSQYNLLDGFASYYSGGLTLSGANDLTGQDPLFVNDLLELDPLSPAVDSGAGPGQVPGIPSEDYAGNSRPAGGTTDRGAHEQ